MLERLNWRSCSHLCTLIEFSVFHHRALYVLTCWTGSICKSHRLFDLTYTCVTKFCPQFDVIVDNIRGESVQGRSNKSSETQVAHIRMILHTMCCKNILIPFPSHFKLEIKCSFYFFNRIFCYKPRFVALVMHKLVSDLEANYSHQNQGGEEGIEENKV